MRSVQVWLLVLLSGFCMPVKPVEAAKLPPGLFSRPRHDRDGNLTNARSVAQPISGEIAVRAVLDAIPRPWRQSRRKLEARTHERAQNAGPYSHSIVPGGLLVTSSTTRLTSATSLVIRVEMRSSTS
jgi:hypothetical protein